ncbi:MAG: sensor histidine kinase [Bacteroidales bacterium]|nr:sensor histidine kinase [Bacteroidales bacterium]
MKYPVTVLLLLFFLPLIGGMAQNIDSVARVTETILTSELSRGNKKVEKTASYSKDTATIAEYLDKAREYQKFNHDSMLLFANTALTSALKLKDLGKISSSVQILGRFYILREDYGKATSCFLLGLNIEEKLGNAAKAADLYDDIGNIYNFQEIFAKSLHYYTKAMDIYIQRKDTFNLAKSYSHLGTLHSSREFCEHRDESQKAVDFSLALQYFEKSIALCNAIHYEPLMINGLVNVAAVYNKFKKPELALPRLLKAIEYYRIHNNLNSLTSTLHTLGRTYFRLGMYDKSIQSLNESLEISRKNNLTDGIQYLFEAMAQTYAADGDYKNAYESYLKYMTLRDSLVTVEKARSLFELETKYQTEKKEKEILQLTTEKREKNIALLGLASLLLIVAVMGYFILKNIRHKRVIAEQTLRIKEQQILEMEKERQLIATKSVLQGEEAERSRMARDLHDGLGGMLSSVKINLSSMKGDSIISEENAEVFNHALRLLDHSITELRRVAHNMMPETLVHYGLKVAYEDFINRIRTDQTPKIDFQFFGEENRYTRELEITLYRIGQELVNNAMKHASASQISLQFIAEPGRICLQVIDDGKGFDTAHQQGGKGIESIRDRVAANNGKFELWSKPGEGTEATIEFLLS